MQLSNQSQNTASFPDFRALENLPDCNVCTAVYIQVVRVKRGIDNPVGESEQNYSYFWNIASAHSESCSFLKKGAGEFQELTFEEMETAFSLAKKLAPTNPIYNDRQLRSTYKDVH